MNKTNNFSTTAWVGFWGGKSNPKPDDKATTSELVNQTTPQTPPETTTPSNIELEQDLSSGYIPEPPPIVDENLILTAAGEPALQSLGLGSWWPSGMVQQALEFLHADLGLPWIQAIALFTVVLRVCLIPITIKAQKNSAKMRKIAPQMSKLNEKLNEAKLSGNPLEINRASHEYMEFMKMSNIGVFTMLVPMAQFPFVISTFIGLKGMCNLPVESLMTSGMLWFPDLTVADPYYILPVLASGSILAIVARGVETGVSAASMGYGTRMLVYGMSAISLPFFIFMPSGVMVYVCTTNLISLILATIFSFKSVKKMLGIPVLSKTEELQAKLEQKKKKGLIEGFKESMKNQSLINEVKERDALREKQFNKAASQLPVRTFKSNPKQQPK